MGFARRANYTNQSYTVLYGTVITEYDLQNAGMEIIRTLSLLNNQKIKWLDSLGKHDRNVQIGLLRRDDRNLSQRMSVAMRETVEDFIVVNHLEEPDVLSIKNDAVYVIGNGQVKTEINDLTFIPKNQYARYFMANRNEFYFRSDGTVDVKGIGEKALSKLTTPISDIHRLIAILENRGFTDFLRSSKVFRDRYINRELPIESYREINQDAGFRISSYNGSFVKGYFDDIIEQYMKYLDIRYNYLHYILPIIQSVTRNGIY